MNKYTPDILPVPELGIATYRNIHLLFKKPVNMDLHNVYPVTYTLSVYDGKTGANLEHILHQFNHIFLQFLGTPEATRNLLPKDMRRKGIMISYRDIDDIAITERNIDESESTTDNWGLNKYWERYEGINVGELEEYIKQVIDNINQLIEETIKDCNDRIDAAIALAEEDVADMQEQIQLTIDDANNKIDNLIETANQQIKDLISDATTDVTEFIQAADTTINNFITEGEKDINNLITNSQNKVDDFIEEAQGTVGDLVDEALEKVTNLISTTETTVNTLITNSQTKIDLFIDTAESDVDSLVTDLTQLVNSTITSITLEANETIDNLNKQIETVVTETNTKVDTMITEATKKILDLIDNVDTTIDQTVDKIETEITEQSKLIISEQIQNYVNGDEFKDYVNSKLEEIALYELPVATTTTLGGIKVGNCLTVTGDGTLSVKVGINDVNGLTTKGSGNNFLLDNGTYANPFPNVSEEEVLTILPNQVIASKPVTIMNDFTAETDELTVEKLNELYPEAAIGFTVNLYIVGKVFLKVNNTGQWIYYNVTLMS